MLCIGDAYGYKIRTEEELNSSIKDLNLGTRDSK
jgi:hypothetical protein